LISGFAGDFCCSLSWCLLIDVSLVLRHETSFAIATGDSLHQAVPGQAVTEVTPLAIQGGGGLR
jgi:hypothetical protein